MGFIDSSSYYIFLIKYNSWNSNTWGITATTAILDAGGTYIESGVNYVPASLVPKPVVVGVTQSLSVKPTNASDMTLFNAPNASVGSGSGYVLSETIPITYGQDFCFYVALSAEENLASNAVLDVSGMNLSGINAGIYYAGVTGSTLTGGNIKVWRFNVPFSSTVPVEYASAPLQLSLTTPPLNVPFVPLADKTLISSELPLLTFVESPNPITFTWLQPNPDGLKVPITSLNLGGVVAINTKTNGTSADFAFRLTANADYVLTSLQVTQITTVPLSLTAPTKLAVLSDFAVSGEIVGTISPTTSAMTSVTYGDHAFPALSEVSFHIDFAPTLKVLNTITMTNPANLAPATLTAINTRRLKIQVMGYLNGGSTTPVALGAPLNITGTAL